MHHRLLPLAICISSILACSESGPATSTSVVASAELAVVSSQADHVTGGTALLALSGDPAQIDSA